MTATETAAVPVRRRSDAGTVRLSRRDITGLVLCAEHAGAPYDLLAAALRAEPAGCAPSWPGGARPGTPIPDG
jgi:hypothetical protein